MEPRECLINDKKAYFHKWVDIAKPIGASALSISHGGHNGGQVSYTIGLVEYEDGTMHECYPHEVRFIDRRSESE